MMTVPPPRVLQLSQGQRTEYTSRRLSFRRGLIYGLIIGVIFGFALEWALGF